jgi:hypothetical protein
MHFHILFGFNFHILQLAFGINFALQYGNNCVSKWIPNVVLSIFIIHSCFEYIYINSLLNSVMISLPLLLSFIFYFFMVTEFIIPFQEVNNFCLNKVFDTLSKNFKSFYILLAFHFVSSSFAFIEIL